MKYLQKGILVIQLYTQYLQILKMKKMFLGVLVLFLVMALGDDKAQKQIPTISVGEVANGVIYKSDRYKSYHLISVASLDKKYLFLSLTTEEIYQHLNLSLSIYKQGVQTAFQKCNKEQVDSCYIPKQSIQANQSLFIVVESEQELEYKLWTYWSDLQHIAVNTEVRFLFSEKEQRQIYHLELEGKEFRELRIIIKPETKRYPFDKIKMYGTFGKNQNPSSEHYDFKSVPLWQDAEGVYLFRQQVKDLNMNLILYGMTETVYTMKCELSNNTHNDLAINSKIYQYLQQSERYTYHIDFKNKEGKFYYDTYVLKVSTFNGDLKLDFYSDEKKTEEIKDLNPYMYMGDIQYLFSQEQINKMMPKGLYIEAESETRVTTFMMEFEGRTQEEGLELHQHIYEFLLVEKMELAYFKVGKYGEKETPGSDLRVVFSSIGVVGRVGVEFRQCTKPKKDCLGDNYTQNTQHLTHEIRQVGSKATYTIILTQDMFNNINNVEQEVVIIVVVNNMMTEDSFAALEYNVGNRPQFLRENKPIESHVRRSQLKIYKYVCQDPSVKSVKVHINKIAGCFDIFSFRKIPTSEELTNIAGKMMNGVVQITERLLDDPLVIVISGIDAATYSIVLQTVTAANEDRSFITLSEDVEIKLKVSPNKYEVFEIVPIASSIYFKYKSTGPLHVCLLDQKWTCVDDALPVLANSGDIKVEQFYNRKAYAKVRNPSSSRVVEVTSIFHSKTEDHCQLIKVGELARQSLSEGACLYTIFDQLRDFQVMLIYEEYGKFSYNMLLCDKLISFPHKQSEQQRLIVTKDEISTSCKGHSEYTFSFLVVGDPTKWVNKKPEALEKLNVKYIVQYMDGITVLPDGVGYRGYAKSTELPIKKFSYKLLNKVDTSIVVASRSKLHFLVKVVESVYREQETISLTNFQFSSPVHQYYFLQSLSLKIASSQLSKNACIECELLIYLYSNERGGEMVDYNIEVTQNYVVLEEGRRKTQYLTQNSKAYYGYNAKSKGLILVELSDNNMDCAELYLSRSQFPDENNFDKQSFDGQILFDNTRDTPTTYYVSVLARQNCAYSIGAFLITGQRNVFKLERGILSSLSLKEGEVKYFTFKHFSDSPFKILSLHKYGNIQFYLNQTTHEDVAGIMKQKNINYLDFPYHSEQNNRLLLDPTNKYFCKGCLYILAAVAMKHTESSLFLGDEQTRLPMSQEKVINDILPEVGSSMRGEFYPIEKGIIEVIVHSGKLQVKISYKDQEIKEVFQKSSQSREYNFTISIVPGYYSTAIAVLKALNKNTVYSLRIRSIYKTVEEGPNIEYTTVNPNEANYLYINSNEESCLKGYLKDRNEKVFLSFYSGYKEVARVLKTRATLNGQNTDLSRDLTRNVMSLTFTKTAFIDFVKGIPYELCLSLENDTDSMIIVAMQTEETSLLPENVEMVVNGKQIYDIYPQGEFLLDIFQCRGNASIAYGSSRSQLESKKEKVLDIVGMPDQPHAVKIEGYSNLLLSINSSLSLIRWLPIDYSQEKGIGYYLYSAGTLKYDSVFGEIDFVVQSVKLSGKKTKTSISTIKYNLYISNSEEDLKEASLCERYLPGSVIEYKTIHQQISTSAFKFSINKNKLMDKYKTAENLFAVIVADLSLTTPDKSQEYYRFVYNQQEIPAEIFKPSKLQEYQLIFIIIFLVVLTIALLVFACLCTKVFVPMLGRLKNRVLVEENGLEHSKDKEEKEKDKIEINGEHLQPPPSSDRQNIDAIADAPETEVRMK